MRQLSKTLKDKLYEPSAAAISLTNLKIIPKMTNGIIYVIATGNFGVSENVMSGVSQILKETCVQATVEHYTTINKVMITTPASNPHILTSFAAPK